MNQKLVALTIQHRGALEMADTYFVRRNGKVSGPHSMESIKSAVKSKKITADDLISPSKDGPWKKLKLAEEVVPDDDDDVEVAELAEEDDDFDPLPVSPRESRRRQKLKEADEEKAQKKKKPKKSESSGAFGIIVWVLVGMTIPVALGITAFAWYASNKLAEQNPQAAPAKNDVGALASQPKIAQIDRIIIEIDASLGVGMNVQQLNTKLQQLATEVQLAQREGKKVAKYEKVLEMYKDALTMWELLHDKEWGGTQPEKWPPFLYLTANNQCVFWEYKGHKEYENPDPSPDVAKFEPSRQAYYRSRDKYLRQFKIESTATDILNRNDLWGDVITAVFPDGGGVDTAYQQVGTAKKVKVPVDCVFKLTAKARKMIGK